MDCLSSFQALARKMLDIYKIDFLNPQLSPTGEKMSTTLKLSLIALAAAASFGAVAQTKAPEPDSTISYNVGVFTDYRYRGISQSAKKPAVQAGIDYAHKNGFYLGGWASTITWIKDSGAGASGPVELDVYGGYKGELSKDVAYDVGVLQYAYLGNTYSKASTANANTTEIYGALTFGPVTAKYSHALTNLFGTPKSKNSNYVDLSATFDVGGISVVPHIGVQKVKGVLDYTDYSVTVSKDFDGLVLSGAVVSTNKKNFFTLPGSGAKDLGGTSLVLGIKKNF